MCYIFIIHRVNFITEASEHDVSSTEAIGETIYDVRKRFVYIGRKK